MAGAEFNWDWFQHQALTDVGRKRSHNQDAHGVALARNDETWQRAGHFYIVADGMGAHAVGELASKLAVDNITLAVTKVGGTDALETLRHAITEANNVIHQKGNQNREFQGMGTTATALLVNTRGAFVGHVGDSRCYRIRDNRIEQLTWDHSMQWELARKQNIDPSELKGIPSNIIVRSLGPQPSVKPDVFGPYDVQAGDRFLLCSDGLTGQVTDREIGAAALYLPDQEATRFLVDLANLRGGPDNITVMLVTVGEGKEVARPSWQRRLGRTLGLALLFLGKKTPWPVWPMLLAVVCAILSFVWTERRWEAIGGFLATSLVGLYGLWARRKFLAKRPKVDIGDPAPIYRPQKIELVGMVLDTLAESRRLLADVAQRQNWKLDQAAIDEQQQILDTAQANHREVDAFAALCRIISLFAAALRQHQDKHEVLMPQWDKPARERKAPHA